MLFLATPIPSKVENRELFTLFTSKEEYLTLREIEGQSYLGKELTETLCYEELLAQKQHLTSLLKRLYPTTPFPDDALCLLSQR